MASQAFADLIQQSDGERNGKFIRDNLKRPKSGGKSPACLRELFQKDVLARRIQSICNLYQSTSRRDMHIPECAPVPDGLACQDIGNLPPGDSRY